jgi:hypothetical protein
VPVWSRNLPLYVCLALVIVWAIADIASSYPDHFFPRTWDEAIYAHDVVTPQAVFGEYKEGATSYAPAKLGYGLALSAAVSLFGINGAMYLSTVCWLLAILLVGSNCARLFGAPAGLYAAAFLSFSPLLGKYLAEAGPTTLAALGFVLFWIALCRRRAWFTGLTAGLIALVDFKWALPAALVFVVNEILNASRQGLLARIKYVILTGFFSLLPIAAALVVHPTFGSYLSTYVFGHAALEGFSPSPIFLYYLVRFGAAPAIAVGIVAGILLNSSRKSEGSATKTAALRAALVVTLVPPLFYSLFGSLKAVRFLAVTFPLMAVALGFSAALIWRAVERPRINAAAAVAARWIVALFLAGSIVVASDGPARHLRLRAGFEPALNHLKETTVKDGSVSSYIWPIVLGVWYYPLAVKKPFLLDGLLATDKWVILDPMLDRVTTDMRAHQAGDTTSASDDGWRAIDQWIHQASAPLFKAPSEYYSSDYFLCENVMGGIPTLRRWHAWSASLSDSLELLQIDPDKARTLRPPVFGP